MSLYNFNPYSEPEIEQQNLYPSVQPTAPSHEEAEKQEYQKRQEIGLSENNHDSSSRIKKHKIKKDTDTLTGLAISYGVSVENIKRANNIISSDLDFYEKEFLIIPDPDHPNPQLIEDDKPAINQVKTIRLFSESANCSREEAKYYLSSNDWDFRTALEEYRADIEWENDQMIDSRVRSTPARSELVSSRVTNRAQDKLFSL
eukprot:gb/GECH01011668.1/.p1 GENE.gb/GECH01011668.1/~~gb/GECH01011668.1/.p1  ORF type:complete len:202 (+),score=63.71 gb/GECH01011668.1/:1-606(+)